MKVANSSMWIDVQFFPGRRSVAVKLFSSVALTANEKKAEGSKGAASRCERGR